jgi:hypothetical protein
MVVQEGSVLGRVKPGRTQWLRLRIAVHVCGTLRLWEPSGWSVSDELAEWASTGESDRLCTKDVGEIACSDPS